MHEKMKPLVSYYGGKQRMASKIVDLLPPHTVYVEPFCGGAAVMFKKGIPEHSNSDHYREVINDKCGDIINLYRCFQDQDKYTRLIRRLQATAYSRREHGLAQSIRRGDVESTCLVDLAWAYFVDLQMSFSNASLSGWGTGVFGRNLSGTWVNKTSRLYGFIDRLSTVAIESMDAIDVIKKWDSPQTCFYVDPPYVGVNQGHYSGYATEDLSRLIDALVKCSGSFVLSSYLNDESRKIIPSDWLRFDFALDCKAVNGKIRTQKNCKRTESVWVIDRSANVRPEIKKIPHFAARVVEYANM